MSQGAQAGELFPSGGGSTTLALSCRSAPNGSMLTIHLHFLLMACALPQSISVYQKSKWERKKPVQTASLPEGER